MVASIHVFDCCETSMAPRIYPGPSDGAAHKPEHRVGQGVDSVDQLSSVTLLGVAVAGAVAALLLVRLIVG